MSTLRYFSGCVVAALLFFGANLFAGETNLGPFDFREVVRSATEKVFPTVVYVKCVRNSLESGKKSAMQVSGSGVLISEKGELLTNWHVVDQALEIRCLLYDGRAANGKVVGTDKDTDLALVQLELPSDTPPLNFAQLGDSTKLREGDFVMAMGAPWGLSRSVSIGIISCTNRFLPEASEYSLWLQTDAAISPGNSGGPLVNTLGEVIGINTRGVMFGGDLGFAVPASTIRVVLPQLREHGKVNWSWMGIQLQPLRDFDANVYFDSSEGIMIAGTDLSSPARLAGLQVRDRIVAVNGKAVTAMTGEDLPGIRRMLGTLPMHQRAQLEIIRDGKSQVVEVTPREKGKVEGDELDFPRWDLTAKAINQFDNPDLYFVQPEGVFIFGVKNPGNASAAGLQHKDIITKVDNQEIKTLDQLKSAHASAVAKVSEKNRVLITVLRNGMMRQVVLDFSRKHEND